MVAHAATGWALTPPRAAYQPRGGGRDRRYMERNLDETVDPAWADAMLPPGMPVQGNIDPLALIAGGEALRAAVARVRAAFDERPYVLNLGHGIVQDTPIAHVEELLALVRG